MEWLTGDWATAPQYALARTIVVRGVALIYVIAFVNAALEWRPLLGRRGLTPVARFVRRVPFRAAPSLFHRWPDDRLAVGLAWFGAALAASVVAGVTTGGPAWLSVATWLVLWALYLSIVNVGQIWYAFGWESILLEAALVAALLGPESAAPPTLALWLTRWLLFRIEFGAGLIKLRGDPCWRDLTCLEYHHETQPMPGPLSWWFHHLPRPLHKVEVLANHGTQLVVPWLLFAPQPVASVAAGIIVVTQSWLLVSGNFSWLNAITIVLAFAAVGDAELAAVLPVPVPAPGGPAASWLLVVVLAATAATAVLSWRPVRNMASRRQRMNQSFNRLHLVNTYGAFGSITRERYELVIEGTDDPSAGDDADWRAYEFKGKPGDPQRRPPQIAPYHLRLDWLMWFAAMSGPRQHPWLLTLVEHLLEGDRPVRRLLRDDPFPHGAPAAIRVRRFRYRYTTPAQRRATGAWWAREPAGTVLRPVRAQHLGR